MKSLRIRGFVAPTRGNAAAVNNQNARIIVVYDRAPNGAYPTTDAIVLGTDSLGGTTLDADQLPNVNNRERFLILRDQFFHLPPLGAAGANPTNNYVMGFDPSAGGHKWDIDWYINLRGLKTTYLGDTSGIASIATGAIYVWTMSTGDTNASPAWGFAGVSRLRWVD